MFKPYKNESDVMTIADLTIENRMDRISIYGNLSITKDMAGLAGARVLQTLINDTVKALESETLPSNITPSRAEIIKNPFSTT